MDSQNPLVSANKAADSRQSVQLHPLVLLNISDYITRHTIRERKDPIVGAILGSQHGRHITMEHAFECKTEQNQDGAILMDGGWFHDRLQQFREVHKQPALDLVGWFTLATTTGPQQVHLSIHRQLAEAYNESILFLAFHPSSLQETSRKGGDKLPITIYEPVYETGGGDGDKTMAASADDPPLSLRFRELPYNVETGDAEMIGVDFVARGGANATAISETAAAQKPAPSKEKGKPQDDMAPVSHLTADEEDTLANMTAKANAIRMLQRRISLLKKYVESLPPCYLTDPSIKTAEPHQQISHPVLRSIASLLARLPLLVPYTPASEPVASNAHKQTQGPRSVFAQESAAQASDVALITLLGTLGNTLQGADKLSKKAQIFENEVNTRRAAGRGGGLHDPTQDSFFEANGDFNGMTVHG